MPYKNTAITPCIYVESASTNLPITGDAANITVRGVGDGTEFTPATPNITEIDATNLKGVYKVSLAAGENNYSTVLLGGKSTTANAIIRPIQWFNETDANIKQVNGGSTGSTAGKLELVGLKVTATGTDHAVDISSADGNGVQVIATGTSYGTYPLLFQGVTVGLQAIATGPGGVGIIGIGGNAGLGLPGGPGLEFLGGGSGPGAGEFSGTGLYLGGGTSNLGTHPDGPGVTIAPGGQANGGTSSAPAVLITGTPDAFLEGTTPGNNDATQFLPTGTGKAINATGQLYIAPTNTNDDALRLIGNGTGIGINSTGLSIKKNTALANFMFVMTDSTTKAPKTGLTVTATRSIDGAAFAASANSVSEVSSGWYKINLAATDVNGTVIALRFTATGANDLDLTVVTQA